MTRREHEYEDEQREAHPRRRRDPRGAMARLRSWPIEPDEDTIEDLISERDLGLDIDRAIAEQGADER